MNRAGLTTVAAVTAAVVGALLSGCSSSPDAAEEATPPATKPSATKAAPTVKPGKAKVETSQVKPAGLNVRYLDDDGKARSLDVKDFPR
jgi:hypothetical protein